MLLSQRNIEGGDMRIGLALAMLIASGSAQAQTPPLRPAQQAFRAQRSALALCRA